VNEFTENASHQMCIGAHLSQNPKWTFVELHGLELVAHSHVLGPEHAHSCGRGAGGRS